MQGYCAFVTGLALGFGSVLSVGPNNLMLLREGLLRRRKWLVASTVFGSHTAMLAIACLATNWLAVLGPAMQTALTWLGLLALLWFAWGSLRAALTVREKDRDGQARTAESPLDCLRRALAVVWLNPLTYIEFLLIPAVLCATYSNMHSRLQFVFGLVCMTAISCYGYSLGGLVCAPLIRDRHALQIFDLASGGILTGVAFILATTLVHA